MSPCLCHRQLEAPQGPSLSQPWTALLSRHQMCVEQTLCQPFPFAGSGVRAAQEPADRPENRLGSGPSTLPPTLHPASPLTPLHTPALSSLAYPSPLCLDHMMLADHTVRASSLLQESSRILSCETSLLSQDLFLVWQHLLCTVLICPRNSPMSLQGKKPRLRNWFQDTVHFLFLSLPPSLLPSPPTQLYM